MALDKDEGFVEAGGPFKPFFGLSGVSYTSSIQARLRFAARSRNIKLRSRAFSRD